MAGATRCDAAARACRHLVIRADTPADAIMPSISEYTAFTDALRTRRQHILASATEAARGRSQAVSVASAAQLLQASELLEAATGDLGAAEEELRAQNEELFTA